MSVDEKDEKIPNFQMSLERNEKNIFKETISKFDVANDIWIPDKAKQNYHQQRLGQSKWAFRLSLWGGLLGFIIIILSLIFGLQEGNVQNIGLIAGAIVEAVSALFYTLSNRANEKITEFFQELTIDSNIERALALVEKVKSDSIRDELLVKLSLHLSGINEERICKKTNEICNVENLDNRL